MGWPSWSKTALRPVLDALVWMMWSLSLSKYAKTRIVVSAVLIFSNACCCSDSQAQIVSHFCSLLRGSANSVKTGLNLFR